MFVRFTLSLLRSLVDRRGRFARLVRYFPGDVSASRLRSTVGHFFSVRLFSQALRMSCRATREVPKAGRGDGTPSFCSRAVGWKEDGEGDVKDGRDRSQRALGFSERHVSGYSGLAIFYPCSYLRVLCRELRAKVIDAGLRCPHILVCISSRREQW